MPYKVADGSDVAEVSLTLIVPQPRSDGVQVTRRSHSASGSVIDEGKYIELVWDVVEDAAELLAILTYFGLEDPAVPINPVTLLAVDENYAATRWNGIAVRPEPGREIRKNNFFLRSLTVLVKELEAAT